ncbi:GspE/PulE family protein [Effusibacillus dendaii]|uniref:Bacterial type II secretion system protein E domain-containing protein n=1 Tax=Effusibacillus dendaii TaxID=2743772 RepID=A0A7I8D9G2_9BACL|nr:GspE/PulE family protein [Effusibacillus dendaii]BCJ86002.1 hypothetical protein skT53_09870 [Effusibacillus dendaii]
MENPVIDWVQHVIDKAIRIGASDIHIEPSGTGYETRFRGEGDLFPADVPLCEAGFVQRIKVLAEMDIAERRMPQDGSFQQETSQGMIDVRVSSLPTVSGEKLALRLLRRQPLFDSIQQLCLKPDLLQELQGVLAQMHGMLIVTGPTGCGKSTTLFAILRSLQTDRLNIVTLEDPVESRIAGINQVQINEKAGLTFAKGLRSILRQDPDVIMVGEIRDGETAEIAVRAALTGHLVLSTLHTYNCEGALLRLLDLGVEPYLVAAAVKAVISQRLVKRVAGGRRAIFSMLTVTDDVQAWLQTGAITERRPSQVAVNDLQQALHKLILEGEVAAEEYERIFGVDVRCLEKQESGEKGGKSPDFVHEWPDSYKADSPSIRASR